MRAGLTAIALKSKGFISTLLYETIEEMDARQVEAIRATGANKAQLLAYSVVLQVLHSLAGTIVYRQTIV